jgi:hypothetical protein
MKSRRFDLLLDYLKKTDSRILMPLIVYRELGGVYKSKLSTRLKAYKDARELLERSLTDAQIPSLEIDIPSEVEKYLEFVKKRLKIRDKDIIPYREHYLDNLVARAIMRRKPFSEKGEEFRDALLWLTFLDVAREAREETLAFISNDAKAFGHSHQLHEALLHEAEGTGKQVNFYNSIKKFIESHASQIEYITPSWLFSAINFDDYSDTVTENLEKYLERFKERDLARRGWEGLEFNGCLCVTDPVTEENLAEYYVYEQSDGSLYIQANFYIEYDVEFIFEEKMKQERFSRYSRTLYDYENDYDDEYRTETKTIYKHPEVEVIFEVMVKDRQVIDVELSSVYL